MSVRWRSQRNGVGGVQEHLIHPAQDSAHISTLPSFRTNRAGRAWYRLLKALLLAPNRRQVKMLLVASIPALGVKAIDWADYADNRLWQWRAQLRKTLVG